MERDCEWSANKNVEWVICNPRVLRLKMQISCQTGHNIEKRDRKENKSRLLTLKSKRKQSKFFLNHFVARRFQTCILYAQ